MHGSNWVIEELELSEFWIPRVDSLTIIVFITWTFPFNQLGIFKLFFFVVYKVL